MIPDFEALVGDYLRGHDQLQAMHARVSGTTPTDETDPWIRVSMLDPRDETAPTDHLISCLMQLDCYAGKDGGQDEATLLMRRTRAALLDLKGVQGAAVVSAVTFGGCPRIPDTSFKPARERYAMEITVYAHP